MSAADRHAGLSPGSGAHGSARPAAPRRPVRLPARLPDPPLVDDRAGIVLRPWAATPGDVAALVAAWSDPLLAAADGVPEEVSAAGAARWIRGDAERRAAGACLDLVIAPAGARGGDGTVFGEVGLRNIDQARRRAEVSWWLAPEYRGRGVAAAAARLLAGWALSPAGGLDQVWARIDPANTVSARVAAAAGLIELGRAGGTTVWSRTRAATPPRSA